MIIFVLAFIYCGALFAQTITNTNVKINDTNYSCKGTSYTAYDSTGLGVLSSISLNGSIKSLGSSGISSGTMYYRFDGGVWRSLILDDKSTISQNPGEKAPEVPGTEGNDEEVPALNKTLATYEIFSRSSNYPIDMSGLINGDTYNLDIFYRLSSVYDPADTSGGNYYTNTYTKTAAVYFTDGSSYSPAQLEKSSTNQPFARFSLNADVTGASMTDIFIRLDGTREGFSNIKLWSSADNSFDAGSDSQVGETQNTDPGAGAEIKWTGISESIGTSITYYFLTADLDLAATGTIQGIVVDESKITVTGGVINNTISEAALSSSDVPCPITLASFSAEALHGKVELSWTTESENENSHFILYRNGDKIARIPGHGTSSETHDYAYTDVLVKAGVYEYVLADVSFSGIENMQAPVNVEIESDDIELSFILNKAYPNPFNPRTAISYQLSAISNIDLSIYSTSGEKVVTLFSGEQAAGQHQILWNAAGNPSGIYILKMLVGDVMQSQKMVLIK